MTDRSISRTAPGIVSWLGALRGLDSNEILRTMTMLVVGVALFLGIHLVPSVRGVRARARRALGENGYKGMFSLVSLSGFVLLVWGKARAPYVHVWSPPGWGRPAALTLMFLSCASLAAIYLPTNLKRLTAHPMLWATLLWATAHLFANGDLASIVLFGGFLAFSVFDIWSANARGATVQTRRVPKSRDVTVLGVGIALYVSLLLLHPYAFGVAVLPG